MPFRNLLLIAALVLAGCTAATSPSSRVDETRVRMLLTSLAHDWALRNMLSPPDARRTRRQLRATVDVVWRSFAPSTPRSD